MAPTVEMVFLCGFLTSEILTTFAPNKAYRLLPIEMESADTPYQLQVVYNTWKATFKKEYTNG